MSEKSPDKDKQPTSSFTVDADTTQSEMPSVTKLLNRKSFSKSITYMRIPSAHAPENPAAHPAAQVAPVEISLSPIPAAAAEPPIAVEAAIALEDDKTVAVNPAIVLAPGTAEPPIAVEAAEPAAIELAPQPAGPTPAPADSHEPRISSHKRAASGTSQPLHIWQPSALRKVDDPLGKALAGLLDGGVTQALFLSIQPVAGKAPVFIASAAVNAGAKDPIWRGISWDPSLLPGVWSQLISPGFVELPPPGTMTNLHSERNVSRAAFDVGNEESLYVARVGPPQQCRGILALISKKALTTTLNQVLPLLNALPSDPSDNKAA